MPIVGTVIAESLHGDAALDLPLTLTRIQRVGVTGIVAGQPSCRFSDRVSFSHKPRRCRVQQRAMSVLVLARHVLAPIAR